MPVSAPVAFAAEYGRYVPVLAVGAGPPSTLLSSNVAISWSIEHQTTMKWQLNVKEAVQLKFEVVMLCCCFSKLVSKNAGCRDVTPHPRHKQESG
jgi:hypothetical protein